MGFQVDAGTRMKQYESVFKQKLINQVPVIMRLDGKAFHTYTKNFDRPFDKNLHDVMVGTMKFVMESMQGAVLGYTQSDEISILLKDWPNINTQQWFDGTVQKMVSVSASAASAYFNKTIQPPQDSLALFDSRVFQLPKEEVNNYFVWRQQDATRNSVQMLARAHFSHKSLHSLNNSAIHEKLWSEKNINWNDLDVWKKRGTAIVIEGERGFSEYAELPIFTKEPDFINQLVFEEEK